MSNVTQSSNSTTSGYSACLIGCGKMGGAMLRSWLDNDILSQILVIDPSHLDSIFLDDPRITHKTTIPEGDLDADILILAVKPQVLKGSTEGFANRISSNTVILSIAAGQSLATLSSILGNDSSIVRSMPNTPASIGKGMSVSVASGNVSSRQKETVNTFLDSIGLVEWIEDETLMDAVTALSGSGPAYVFYLIEVLSKAGEKIGLSPAAAQILARQTVIGSAALAEHEPSTRAKTLRENVTSPGGTTQAALEVLMDGRLEDLFTEALASAKKRSVELNQ